MPDCESHDVFSQVVPPKGTFSLRYLSDPLMIQSLSRHNPLVCVNLEHLRNQVLRFIRNGVPDVTSHLIISLLYLDDEIVQPLRIERQLPWKHCIEDAPSTPHVHRFTYLDRKDVKYVLINSTWKYLRGWKPNCPRVGPHLNLAGIFKVAKLLILITKLGHIKVGDFDQGKIIAAKDIIRFKISMANKMVMQIVNRRKNLRKKRPCVGL